MKVAVLGWGREAQSPVFLAATEPSFRGDMNCPSS